MAAWRHSASTIVRAIPLTNVALTVAPGRAVVGWWRRTCSTTTGGCVRAPRHWLPLDRTRPRKDTALVLDLGRTVRPTFTPDDPALVQNLLSRFVG